MKKFKTWVSKNVDKVLHLVGGFGIFQNIAIISGSTGWAWITVIFIAFLIEVNDSRKGGSGFDVADLFATIAGGAFAAFLLFIYQSLNFI